MRRKPLTAVITEPEKVAPKEAVTLNCEAPDDALLFADWLNALVYEMATRKMLFSRFNVKETGQPVLIGGTMGTASYKRRERGC